MKNIITGFAAGVLLLLAFTYFFKPCWFCEAPSKDRKPLLSLADLAMEVSEREGNNLQTLVSLDKQFYKALLQGNAISDKYFYARHGSCCPCTSGGMRCCMCPPRAGFGAMQGSIEISEAFLQGQSKIELEENETEGVRVFLVPPSVKSGNYTLTFKGKINVELDVAVNADQTFEVIAIR
jgi:hypothetical protein